jgi:hypothetical protein
MRTTVALVITLSCINFATAQDDHWAGTTASGDFASSTSFRPLTTWEKIKLGGAYYTNPQLVSNAAVAYTYDPKSFASVLGVNLKELAEKKWLFAAGMKPTQSPLR